MKIVQLVIILILIFNCNSIVELRSQKTAASVRPEEVKAGCYRQVGMLKAVYKNVLTTEVEPAYSISEPIPARKDTKTEKIIEREAYNSCSYNGDILFCKEIPPAYKEVTVEVEYPAHTKTIQIPEIKKTVLKPTVLEQEKPDIRSILCPENATVYLIKKMQENLKAAGFDPGDTNGKLYRSTMNAIKEYEIRKGFRFEERSGDDFIMQNTVNILGK